MKPDNQLLFFSGLPAFKQPERGRLLSLLPQIRDWDRLLKKAFFHRLQPRLYFFLKQYDANSFLPSTVWRKIESAQLWAQAYTLALEAELESVLLPRFQAVSIAVMLLKGAALLQDVYRGKPLRFFVDLDLLIRRQDLSAAQGLLPELGYKSLPVHFPSQWHESEIYSRIERTSFPYFHPERGIHVDLHTEPFEMASGLRFGSEWLWEDARTLPVDSSVALLPHPNKLFLHLLFHLEKHAATGTNVFAWYLDLNECLRHFETEIDGPFCRNFIEQSPRADSLLKILAFLGRWLPTHLPRELEDLLREKAKQPFSLEKILASPKKYPLPLDSLRDAMEYRELVLSQWQQIPSVPKKIWIAVRWLFPDRQYLEASYPFQTLSEKLQAYLKHFFGTLVKGIAVGFDWLAREIYRPRAKK